MLYGKRDPADVIKAPNPLILRQVDYLTQSLKLFKSRSGSQEVKEVIFEEFFVPLLASK